MSDWDTQTVLRKSKPGGGGKGAVRNAQRSGGGVETSKKYGAGGQTAGGGMDAASLDRETEELKHKKVEKNLGKLIAQTRNALGMNTKELATKCNEKPQIITQYEQGKAIPNQQIIGKIERALGISLRGKTMGQPKAKPGAGKKKK